MKYTKGMILQDKETQDTVIVGEDTFWGSNQLITEDGDKFYLYTHLIDKKYQQLQRVWLCLSDAGHSGYFIWDIWEEVGNKEENGAPANFFTDCRDGSRIMVQCNHFFTKERAQKHIDSYNLDSSWLSKHVIRIGE